MRSTMVVGSATLMLAFVLTASRAAPMPQRRDAPKRATAWPRSALTVGGSVRGLYPGARVRLRLTLRNRRSFPISVRSLRARPTGASDRCRSANIKIERFRGTLLVPAHGARLTVLHVTMVRSAPDGCKRAVFRLRFAARGRRA
jgi:hypothetical protein